MRVLLVILALLALQGTAEAQQLTIGGNLAGNGNITFVGSTMTGHLYGNGDLTLNGLTPFSITNPTNGQCLVYSGVLQAWQNSSSCGSGGSGTVTNVSATVPSWLNATVTNPTTTPAITITAATGQTANQVLATPNGSSGTVTPRALVVADLPTIPTNQIAGCVVNSQTGTSYTLALSDANNCVNMTTGGVVTIPVSTSVALPVGGSVTIIQGGANVTTIVGSSGVTIQNYIGSPLTVGEQSGFVTLQEVSTDVWTVTNPQMAIANLQVLNLNTTNDGTHQNGQCLGATNWACSAAPPSIFNGPGHSAGPAIPGKDLIIVGGAGVDSTSVYLAGNGYINDIVLGYAGDQLFYSAAGQPYFTFKGGNNLGSSDVDLRVQADAAVAYQFGITNSVSTRCPNIGSSTILPTLSIVKCTYGFIPPGYPWLLFTATGGKTIALAQFDSAANYERFAVGGTSPVYWAQATSTGSNAVVVLGNASNSASALQVTGPSPTLVSGFGSGAGIVSSSGPYSFSWNVGTGGTASTGVIGLVTSPGGNGYACSVHDVTNGTTNFTDLTGSNASSITVTNFGRTTGVTMAWTSSDVLEISCWPN